jgi:hypothetical protein
MRYVTHVKKSKRTLLDAHRIRLEPTRRTFRWRRGTGSHRACMPLWSIASRLKGVLEIIQWTKKWTLPTLGSVQIALFAQRLEKSRKSEREYSGPSPVRPLTSHFGGRLGGSRRASGGIRQGSARYLSMIGASSVALTKL